MTLRVEAGVSSQYHERRRQALRMRRIRRLAGLGVAALALLAIVFGIVYGSSGDLPGGVQIQGVDVGGLSSQAAVRLLTEKTSALGAEPLVVHVAGHAFKTTSGALGVAPNWGEAVARAKSRGDGFAFVGGFKRLYVRFFGAEVSAAATSSRPALGAFLDRIEKTVDRPHREAALERRGLKIVVVSGRKGRVLDRKAAETALLGALSGFERKPLWLPTRVDEPQVTAQMLEPVAAKARLALSQPVRLALGSTYYRVPRWRLAQILQLPGKGQRDLRITGKGADQFFGRLEKAVNRPARDARFVVDGSKISIRPDAPARALDVPTTAKNLLAAALSPTNRVAKIVVGEKPAGLTLEQAQAMGITGLVSGYTTEYGGDPNRIHNVQLVAQLIDDTLIRPGQEFSFNATTGDRTAAKGFLEAPVIINGELKTGLGGGVCQVSTTVFNAAYEAGLDITARTNHALYISHYPQGRDATVNYPDTDLKFVNDTDHWLLLRTFVGSYSLTVNLYGTPVHRRVVSETGALETTGPPPVKKVKDPDLFKGEKVIEEAGSPSLSTSARRQVFSQDGKLLHENVWYSSYRGEFRIVHIGTKPRPKPKPAKPQTPDGPIVIPPSGDATPTAQQ